MWINLKTVMLSERSQTQKAPNHIWLHLCGIPEEAKRQGQRPDFIFSIPFSSKMVFTTLGVAKANGWVQGWVGIGQSILWGHMLRKY
jgi:hypothetical protein